MSGPCEADRILVDIRQVARMTCLSVRTLERLVSTGRFPPPVRLGRKRLWQRARLEQWLADGCHTVPGRKILPRSTPERT